MGPGRAAEIIREGLYRGADNGYLLTDRAFAGADTGLYLRRRVDWRALLHPAGGRCETRWIIFQLWNMRHTTAHNPLS